MKGKRATKSASAEIFSVRNMDNPLHEDTIAVRLCFTEKELHTFTYG
jgi:hypothetical protein